MFSFTEKKDIGFSKLLCVCCMTAPIKSPKAFVVIECCSVVVTDVEELGKNLLRLFCIVKNS